jgi:hypothetical protein
MIKKTLIVTAAVFALGGLFLFPKNGRAAECTFQEKIGSLKSAQGSRDYYVEGVKNELQIRKDTLRDVIDCAIKETKDLRSQLNIQKTDEELTSTQRQLLQQLDSALRFYQDKRTAIDEMGVRGTQDLARSIKESRLSTFTPSEDNSRNLILWEKNQPLFKTAQSRFDQINRAVTSLGLDQYDDVKDSFRKSKDSLEGAKKANMQAKDALKSFTAPDDISALIKSSLDKLSETYQAFSDLSSAVKKIMSQ